MKRRRRCPECDQLIEVRGDGTFRPHGVAWKGSPPPGAPMCPKSRQPVKEEKS